MAIIRCRSRALCFVALSCALASCLLLVLICLISVLPPLSYLLSPISLVCTKCVRSPFCVPEPGSAESTPSVQTPSPSPLPPPADLSSARLETLLCRWSGLGGAGVSPPPLRRVLVQPVVFPPPERRTKALRCIYWTVTSAHTSSVPSAPVPGSLHCSHRSTIIFPAIFRYFFVSFSLFERVSVKRRRSLFHVVRIKRLICFVSARRASNL